MLTCILFQFSFLGSSCYSFVSLEVLFFILFIFFHVNLTFFHPLSLACSLRHTAVKAVACLFASPLPRTPFPTLLHLWPFLQNSPPRLLQTCPSTPPPPPPACLSQLRGTHSLAASLRPWRRCCPFTRAPLSPGPSSGGPACLPCSSPL